MALDLTNRKTGEALAKLPFPSNKELFKLFDGVDKVIIKEGGVYEESAIKDNIVLIITTSAEIATFISLFDIQENASSFYCLCCGDHAIELHAGNKLVTTIGFHHGVSIRYNNWRSDAALNQPEALLQFLNTMGLQEPLRNWLAEKESSSASKVAQSAWLSIAPKCFKDYINKTALDDKDIVCLQTALSTEIPDNRQQIIRLLQVFGKSTAFWSGYPIYEEMPMLLLDNMNLAIILDTYLNSDRNYKTRRGLARYLFHFRYTKLNLRKVPLEVINDLEKFLHSVSDEYGLAKISEWRTNKT